MSASSEIVAPPPVTVTAAAGGVGSIQVQLAAHRGARVIGTCGSRNFDYLRQIGITPVEYGPGIVERIDELTLKKFDRVRREENIHAVPI